MEWFRIKNWDYYQHYTKRDPPWIKLHFTTLQSQDWISLNNVSRVLMVVCMLVASKNQGKVPNNPNFLKRVGYLTGKPNFKPLIECGFLEKVQAVDSTMQANIDTEEEEETDSPNGDGKPSDQADLKTRIFGPALEWLVKQTGKPESSMRAMLGKWCRDHDDGSVLDALTAASRNAPLDPIPYVNKLLKQNGGGKSLTPAEQVNKDKIIAARAAKDAHLSAAGLVVVPGPSTMEMDSAGVRFLRKPVS